MGLMPRLSSLFNRGAAEGGPARRPLTLERLEGRLVPSTVSSITSNFNGTSVPAGDTIWFSSVFKPSGLGSSPVTLRVTDQTISFTANGTPYTLSVPDSVITLSPATSAANATASFDAGQNAWAVSLPAGFSGNGFLSAATFYLNDRLPGGVNPVTWRASFSTDTPGVSLNWQWAAAAYTSFGADPGVKPLDVATAAYHNSDHAGTPEAFKAFVTGGVRGGGGSNYTGSYSATARVTPEVQSPAPPPASLSGYVYYDADADGVRDNQDTGIGGVVITLYDASNHAVAQAVTDASGFYSFAGLAPGTYTIQEAQPDSYLQGTNNLGSLGGTLGPDLFIVTAGAGDNGTNYNFGELLGTPST
jgi:hypothetical protein